MFSLTKKYYSKKNFIVPRLMLNEACNKIYTKEHRASRSNNKHMNPDNKTFTYKSVWVNKTTYMRAQERIDAQFMNEFGFTEDEFYLMLGYEIHVEEKNM